LLTARGPVNYWRLLDSLEEGRQSVKLIVLIILIEYDYRVVSNGRTKSRSTASESVIPCFCTVAFLGRGASPNSGA